MSHKIKINLCEVFGVKEGEEFKIDESGWKYKIENNNVFSYSNALSSWIVSCLPVNVLADSSYQIEILKPETPPEIKKMLQGFYDMGFTYFYYSNTACGWIFKGSKVKEGFWDNDTFGEWADSFINESEDSKHYNIKDFI